MSFGSNSFNYPSNRIELAEWLGSVCGQDSQMKEKVLENKILEARNDKTFTITTPKKDGGYYTFNLPKDKNGTRRKIQKHTRLEVLQEVYLFYYGEEYCEESKKLTFKVLWEQWVQSKRELADCNNIKMQRASGTIRRYINDYKRFFSGHRIEKMNMRRVAITDLENALCECFNEKPEKAVRNVLGNVRQLITYAYRNKQISENYSEFWDKERLLSVAIVPEPKSDDVRYLTEEQADAVYSALRKWEQKKVYLAHYACELSLETGMRIGELVALKWDHIHDGFIWIDTAERREGDGTHTIVEPKNKKHRRIPITEPIQNLLQRIKDTGITNADGFIFINQKGNRFTGGTLGNAFNRFGEAIFGKGFNLSSHQIRRTKNADMERAGIPIEERCKVLGHTPETNLRNYTGQNATQAQQTEMLEKVSPASRNKVVPFKRAV